MSKGTRGRNEHGLTNQQQRFVDEYLIDRNGAQAAIRAGYSPNKSQVTGSYLLTIPNIRSQVDDRLKAMTEASGVTAQRVIDELAKLGFTNIQDFLTDQNTVASLKGMDPAKTAAVSGIKVEEVSFGDPDNPITKVVTTLKLADKRAALVDLGRHLGIFEKDNLQKDRPQVVHVTLPSNGREGAKPVKPPKDVKK